MLGGPTLDKLAALARVSPETPDFEALVCEPPAGVKPVTVLHEVLRYEPKTFRQRRPDGKGGWQRIGNQAACTH